MVSTRRRFAGPPDGRARFSVDGRPGRLRRFRCIGALVTPGDAARTALDIAGSPELFRPGIAGLILVVILDSSWLPPCSPCSPR